MDLEASRPSREEVGPDETARSRTLVDRRKPGLRSIYYGMFNPRRRRVRREDDEVHAFLDWHPRVLLAVATSVLLLSLADGLITVRLVSAGVQELNPLLAAFVHGSPAAFALVKWLLTACGVSALVIAAHARVFGRIKGATVLYGVSAAYLVLVAYGLLLAVSIPH